MIFAGKKRIKLTPSEAELAYLLLKRSPHVVLRDHLVSGLYGLREPKSGEACVRIWCSSLRKKLAGTRVKIEAIRDRGMRMICN